MNLISVKQLIDFSDYSSRRKENFAYKMYVGLRQDEKIKKEDGTGGDYWNRSISAISNSFKMNNNQFIIEKIKDITDDKQKTTNPRTINQYDSNLHNLYNYVDFNFEDLRNKKVEILDKHRKSGVLSISAFNLKTKVHQIFKFEEKDTEMIGAILFVANKKGFTNKQLGMYAEAVFMFLTLNYSDKYTVSSENIIIVDVYSTSSITHKLINEGKIPLQLDSTLLEIKNILKI